MSQIIEAPGFRESLISCLASSPRDWSLNAKDAWLYGIICGWEEENLKDIIKLHSWSSKKVYRLQKLRRQFLEAVIPKLKKEVEIEKALEYAEREAELVWPEGTKIFVLENTDISRLKTIRGFEVVPIKMPYGSRGYLAVMPFGVEQKYYRLLLKFKKYKAQITFYKN